MINKLPPIPEESFDGEKESVDIKSTKCTHKNVEVFQGNKLLCKCGAGWEGHNIYTLYKLLKAQTT